MNSKLLLVHAVTLLYRESQLIGTNENSSQLVREIISAIKLPEISIGIDQQRDIIAGLKGTALAMCDDPIDHIYEIAEILQRVKVNTIDEPELYEALFDGMSPDLTPAQIKRTCLNLKRTLNNHFREEKVQDIMSKATQKLKFNRNKITDMKKFVAEVCSELEPYQVDTSTIDPAIITEVDMHDADQVSNVFKDIKEQASGVSMLKTGFQGINRMFLGGFRRGMQIACHALEHNYKTGFSLTLFKQIAIYNIPHMTDITKKPLLVRISFEDSTALNFQFLYRSFKENETGVPVDISSITEEEMSSYVRDKMSVNGYHTKFLHVNPSLWTYKDICNKIIEYEAEGYEIHMCMVDYLAKIPTTGCDQGPMGHDLRNMFERVRNFMSARNILFFTPHQLSVDARKLIREGRQGLVKELPGKGYYTGSTQLGQVFDGEFFMHIEIINNEAYLTIQRGKHRIIEQTPYEDLYCVLKFNKDGGIPDDLGKADSTRIKCGGGVKGSGEEIPFFEFTE